MKARTLNLRLFLMPLFLLAAINICAATLVVTKTADTADGACDADCSLREAVMVAAPGDLITFSDVFRLTPQTIALTQGQIAITRGLSIQGPGAALLDLSGSGLNRIFDISNAATVAISDLTIRNGVQQGIPGGIDGGGIRIYGNSSLTLTNVIFHHNLARYLEPPFSTPRGAGGAVYSDMSTLTVTNCEFYSNTAGAGAAGISSSGPVRVTGSNFHNNNGNPISGLDVTVSSSSFIANTGGGVDGGVLSISDSLIEGNFGGPAISNGSSEDVMTVDRCVIRNNFNLGGGRRGAGIAAAGTIIIRSSSISGNQVGSAGGGVYNHGVMYIVDSSITGNSAGQKGGGIYNSVGRLYLTNSTLSSNRAPKGGGAHNEPVSTTTPSQILLTNSTISFNTATGGAGGGILADSPGIVESKNSLISSNTSTQGGTDFFGAVTSNGFNLVRNAAGSTGWTTTDLLGIDPMLAPLGSNGGNGFTHALLPGSPAINAGSNALAIDPQTGQTLATDQRGTLRILGTPNSIVDIGAFEANYGPGPVYFEGRLLTSSGRGLPNARVVLTGTSGEPRYAVTNPFGYYRFFGLTAGQTYTLTATAKFYSFAAPLVVTADQDRNDLLLFGGL
ncbi:hypothetical protein BH10ACI3_BH10ACI3_29550 [soil metagenome]